MHASRNTISIRTRVVESEAPLRLPVCCAAIPTGRIQTVLVYNTTSQRCVKRYVAHTCTNDEADET